MTEHQNLSITAAIWLFTALGWIAKLIPVLQVISLILAISVSLVTLYKHFKKKKEHGKTED